jgi:hypothetical protein
MLTFEQDLPNLRVEHVQVLSIKYQWGRNMDLRLTDYLVYLVASVLLTVWVGRSLFRNGRPFLISVFQEPGVADSVNRLLVVGFYLVNLGAAALLINAGGAPASPGDMVQETVTRLGVVLLVLGAMHFFNMFVFHMLRRPLRKSAAPLGPPPPPYQPGAQITTVRGA